MSWTCCISPLSGTNGRWLIFLPVCWLIWGRHQQTTCFGLGDLVVRPSAVKQHVCYFTSLFWFPIMLKYLMVDSKSWLSWVFKTKEAESECQQESSIIGGQHVFTFTFDVPSQRASGALRWARTDFVLGAQDVSAAWLFRNSWNSALASLFNFSWQTSSSAQGKRGFHLEYLMRVHLERFQTVL